MVFERGTWTMGLKASGDTAPGLGLAVQSLFLRVGRLYMPDSAIGGPQKVPRHPEMPCRATQQAPNATNSQRNQPRTLEFP